MVSTVYNDALFSCDGGDSGNGQGDDGHTGDGHTGERHAGDGHTGVRQAGDGQATDGQDVITPGTSVCSRLS